MHPQDSLEGGFDVFISYSRRDAPFARMLGKCLANYSPPKGLGLPARRLKVFLDETDIKGTEYFRSIAEFLGRSRKLILICSPSSRNSPFVDDEVRRFVEARGAEHIIPVLVAGIPNNKAVPGEEDQLAFPEALCQAMKMPLAVAYLDFDPRKDSPRKGDYYGSWYTTLANIFDVSRAEIEQRDKRRRKRNLALAFGLLSAVIAVLIVALIVTLRARNNEALQRARAQSSEQDALRSRDAEMEQRKLAESSAEEARKQRDIATEQRNEAVAQRNRADNALQRASARLLTLQARDEARQSFPRTLLLSAAAIEATAGQRYVEPATEEFLRYALMQAQGGPMALSANSERPMLYDISPDRLWALTSGPGKNPILWRFGRNGQVEQKTVLEAIESGEVIRFSPNSRFLIWAQSPLYSGTAPKRSPGHVTLIPLTAPDKQSGYAHIAITGPSERIGSIRFSSDGRVALFMMDYPEEKPVHAYQFAADGSAIKEWTLPPPPGNRGPSDEWHLTENGGWLVALPKRNEVLAWRLLNDRAAGPYVLKSASEGGDRFVEFSADRKWLVTFGYASTAKLWRLTGDVPARVPFDLRTGDDGYTEHARFSPDGKWLVTAPCLWRLDTVDPSAKRVCLPVPRAFNSGGILDFTADGRRLVAANVHARQASVWDLTAANPAAAPLQITDPFEISTDRRWLVQMPEGRPAEIWDLRDGPANPSGGVGLRGSPVHTAAFADNSAVLATAHSDGSIRIHSLDALNRIATAVARTGGIPPNRLQFSPKGGWLLAQTYSPWPNYVRPDSPHLFQLRKGAAPAMIRLDDSTLEFLTRSGRGSALGGASEAKFEFSPDDDRLVAGETLSSIGYMWDLRSGRVDESRQLLKGHEGSISYFDFVAGGTLITSQLYDRVGLGPYRQFPRLWEPGAHSTRHADSTVRWSRFNRKGDLLATIGDNGTLVVYRLQDGTLHDVLTAKDMGGGIVNRRPVGGYAVPGRPQFLPRFDETGRWLFTASAAGRLHAIDCSLANPKAHEIADGLGEGLLVVEDGRKAFLVNSAPGQSNQLDVWDLSGAAPRRKARLNVDWTPEFSLERQMEVAFLSASRVAVVAPAKIGGKSEVWSYSIRDGARTRDAEVATDKTMQIGGGGQVVAGSQGVYDLRKRAAYRLDGFIPAPPNDKSPIETRFEYRISANGRWAVGRRYTIEGYPEFGRRDYYSWRSIFDLASRDPGHAVVQLPNAGKAVFAEFSEDSNHWVSVSDAGEVTIVSLPAQGAPQITAKKIDQYFSGRAVGSAFWPTGSVSYEVSLSPGGGWLSTRRGDFIYLIRLQYPYNGKLLRGFEAGRGLADVTTSFSPNDDLAMIGSRFWRARVDGELLWPVNLGQQILNASPDGRWIVTAMGPEISLHSLDVSRLVQDARRLAGRELTADEKEQFLLQRPAAAK